MSRALRYLLACLLVVAFAFQQTGASRIAADDCCPEDGAIAADTAEEPACRGPADGDECVPDCDDCLRCASSSRVLLAGSSLDLPDPDATTLERPAFELADGRDPRLRLERPPRA
jgi:hypothetical protein